VTATIRVLTVRQPWAWAIVRGGKDVENRSQNIAGAYRGLVAIHAALASDEGLPGVPSPALLEAAQRGALETAGAWEASYWTDDRGAIVGVVDLVDVHRAELHATAARDLVAGWSPWAERNAWHLVLANPRPFADPVPARGRLGLWRPDEALRAAILDQVGV